MMTLSIPVLVIPIPLLLAVLGVHFIADFIIQTDWQARNKSVQWGALARHVATYSACLCVFGIRFAVINGVLHFFVDAVTSRLSSRMWKQERRHAFFVVIGADQYIHECCLIVSAAVSWCITNGIAG